MIFKNQAASNRVKRSIPYIYLFFISPVICYYIVETFSVSKIGEVQTPYIFLNLFFYFLIHVVLYALIRRVKPVLFLGPVVAYVFGVINFFVIAFKGNPVTYGDIMTVETGMNVANQYLNSIHIDHYFILATIIFLAYLVSLFFIHEPYRRPRFRKSPVIFSMFIIFVIITSLVVFSSDVIWDSVDTTMWNPVKAYSNYGYLVSLFSDVRNSTEIEIENYSPDKLYETDENGNTTLLVTMPEEENEPDTDLPVSAPAEQQNPNIIVIMNESYAELKDYADIQTNIDYMSYVNSLMEAPSTVSGRLAVSSDIGTGTANTEFEVMTGNNMMFFYGTRPYVQFINGETPSLVSVLESQNTPYSSVAIHPYKRSGYKRVNVYSHFGFDRALFDDDFQNPEYIREYISDSESFARVIEEYENKPQGQPVFVLNVTMQNHGGYSDCDYAFSEPVEVINCEVPEEVNTYLSLVKETDRAVSELISYFSAQEEPTIILFFGDHQPKMPTSFYDMWFDDFDNLTLEESALIHQTPFFIWNNYGLDLSAYQDIDVISPNYLGLLLCEVAGVETTDYQRYLSALREEYSVINAIYYTDAQGVKHASSGQEQLSDRLLEYNMLQYNYIFDKTQRIPNFFTLKKE